MPSFEVTLLPRQHQFLASSRQSILKAGLEQNPQSFKLRIRLAELYFNSQKPHRAIEILEENLKLNDDPADMDALSAMPLLDGGETVEEARRSLIASIGENINVRRFVRREAAAGAALSSYLHGNRIGVLVEVQGGDTDLARGVAMHIAASKPLCVDESGVPQELLDKEKEIFSAQAEASGKPADIIEKMVDGRIRKYLAEITLVGQPFVKDPDKTVGALLKDEGANVTGFVRYEVGEGIEKKQENFADEVMAQVNAS